MRTKKIKEEKIEAYIDEVKLEFKDYWFIPPIMKKLNKWGRWKRFNIFAKSIFHYLGSLRKLLRYDLIDIWKRIDELEKRIKKLERKK